MRVWITRLFVLLISANVVYGTQGDVYADKVQVLIKPLDELISYKPNVNTDLFIVTKCKESSGKIDKSFFKLYRNPSAWSVVILASCKIGTTPIFFGDQDEIARICYRLIRKLIFPHHSFA